MAQQEKERHQAIVHEKSLKLERAKVRVAKLQEELDDAIAAAVTTEPTSVTWYTKPGPLTIEEVQGPADLTELQVHRTLERVRPRAKEQARKERDRAKRRSSSSRRRRPTSPDEIGF